jgi:hypothetical protein
VRVHDATTNAVVDTIPGVYSYAVAAPDQRTFYLTHTLRRGLEPYGGEIVRVRLGDDGQVASVAAIPGTRSVEDSLFFPALSADGRMLAYVSADGLVVLDVDSGAQRIWKLPFAEGDVSSLSWTPDGRLAFVFRPVHYSGDPTPSGELRLFDPAKDATMADARRITKGELALPGFGRGLLIDAEVTPDGRSVLAVFATDKVSPQGDAQALIRIALADGAVTVVDDKLQDKHIGEIAYDASRRHLLVFTGQHADNTQGKWGVGRYVNGVVSWLPKNGSQDTVTW